MPVFAEPGEKTPFDVDSLVSTCVETGSTSLLLDAPSIPDEFFDLSTRMAGELLHGLSKYSLKLAAVVPDLTIHSGTFQDFARESNRGQQARFFATRAEAIEWLCASGSGQTASSRGRTDTRGKTDESGDDFYCEEALSGRTPIDIVAETEEVLAFHHTKPFWPVHIVVIPKKHVPSLTHLGEFDESIVFAVLSVVRRIAAQVEAEHGACRVLTNLGRYQDSKHLHFHVNSGEPLR